MTNLLDAARQALDTLTHIIGMRHLSYIGQAMAESAERTLRTAIAEAEKTHCRYPECVENEREECQQCYQQALEAHTWSKAAENYAADAERFLWLAERTAATGLARWVHPFQFLAEAVDARRKAEAASAPPQRQPLTFAQGQELLAIAIKHPTIYEEAAFRKGVKAAERAHGIGDQDE